MSWICPLCSSDNEDSNLRCFCGYEPPSVKPFLKKSDYLQKEIHSEFERGKRTFEVYASAQGNLQAIKKGFSWPGFFFVYIWAFVKGLWGTGLLLILAAIILWSIEDSASRNVGAMFLVLLVEIGVRLFVGFQGNNWRRNKLHRNGYTLMKTIEAKNPDVAITSLAYKAIPNLRTCSNCNTAFNSYPEVCPNCSLPTTCQHGSITRECSICSKFIKIS